MLPDPDKDERQFLHDSPRAGRPIWGESTCGCSIGGVCEADRLSAQNLCPLPALCPKRAEFSLTAGVQRSVYCLRFDFL